MKAIIVTVVFLAVCVYVGVNMYRSYKKKKKQERDLANAYVEVIRPDTGNLIKVLKRLNESEEFKSETYTSGGGFGRSTNTAYSFGDLEITFRHGGEGSRMCGVAFKGVAVPLGTKETNSLETFARKIIQTKNEFAQKQKQQEEIQILQAL